MRPNSPEMLSNDRAYIATKKPLFTLNKGFNKLMMNNYKLKASFT